MKPRGSVCLQFLIYRDEDDPEQWVAHCLELDVVAVESTQDKAIRLLKELIEDLFRAALADGTIDKVFRPAPPKYWQALLSAEPYEPGPAVTRRHIKAEPVRRVDYALAQ